MKKRVLLFCLTFISILGMIIIDLEPAYADDPGADCRGLTCEYVQGIKQGDWTIEGKLYCCAQTATTSGHKDINPPPTGK